MAAADGSGEEHTGTSEWWAHQRYRYNKWLAAAGLLAAVCSLAALRWVVSMGGGPTPKRTAWTTLAVVVAVGYGLATVAANVCYFLGPLSERLLQPQKPDRYRRITFRLGLWLSVLLSLLVPALFACFGLVGALMGEGTPVARAELAGSYIADYGFATDALTLTSDGRFTQEVTIKATRKRAVSRGTWRYDATRRDLYLYGGFMVVVDYEGTLAPSFDHPKPSSMGVLRVRHTAWAMELGGDDMPWGREGIEIPHTKQPHKTTG